jgi:peroxiredoxin
MKQLKLKLLITSAFLLLAASMAAFAAPGPRVGDRVIEFKGSDVDGRPWQPSSAAGRPIAMFFFCGCDACHRLARDWAGFQRSGVVARAAKAGAKPPLTVAVFSGDSQAAKLFASQTRLAKDVLLIVDPDMKTTNLYQAEPCPRVFVIDRSGVIRYTNNSADDAPQGHDEQVIAFKALKALRAD